MRVAIVVVKDSDGVEHARLAINEDFLAEELMEIVARKVMEPMEEVGFMDGYSWHQDNDVDTNAPLFDQPHLFEFFKLYTKETNQPQIQWMVSIFHTTTI